MQRWPPTAACDLFFSIGTSAQVYPAASLPFDAMDKARPWWKSIPIHSANFARPSRDYGPQRRCCRIVACGVSTRANIKFGLTAEMRSWEKKYGLDKGFERDGFVIVPNVLPESIVNHTVRRRPSELELQREKNAIDLPWYGMKDKGT